MKLKRYLAVFLAILMVVSCMTFPTVATGGEEGTYADIATTKTVGGVLPVGTETFNGFATPKYYTWLESKTALANGDIAGVWAVTDKAYTTLTLLVEIANYDFDGDPTAAIVTVTVDGTEYTMDAEGTKTGEFTGALYNADGTSVKTNDDEDPATSVWYEFQLPLSGKAAGDKVVASISYGSSAIAAGYITLGEYTPYKTITYQMDGRDVICITRVYEAGDAEGLLVIPKEIDGKPVVHLGDFPDDSTSILGNNPWVKAVQIQNPGEGLAVELRKKVFSWTSLESIIIDSDVVLQGNALPEQFAYGSTALTSVQLPDSITLIKKEAFRNCTSLTSVNMPAELVEIGPNAFRSAPLTGLEIVLSEKVTKVGYAAFYACGGLASVTALNKDCVFEVGGGMWDGHPFVATSCVFKGYTGSTLETFCAEQTLSERFVALDPLEDIATTKTVGGVLPVGTETFNGFATPKYYAWLESKTELANGDIAGVWAVTDKAYTTLTLLVEIANYDFDGDPTAAIVTVTVDGTEYTMDAEGTKTGEFTGALYNADGTSVKTNDDEDPATSVWYEFQLPLSGKAAGDKVVASISYGSSAIAAGYITLGEYTPYKTITYQMDGRDVICITRVYEAGDAEGLLVIPKEIDGKPVVHLGDFADDSTSILGNNPWVKAVQIQNPGEGLAVELRKKVFSWTSLESIIIDSDVVLQGNALPEQFAYGSTALTSVQLPDSITLINKEAFRNCTSLTSVNMPAELVEIGPNAFRSAPLTGLEIVLSEKVTKVGYAAFYACGGLASVTALNKDCVFEVGGGMWDGHPFVATSCVFKGYTGSTLETFCAEQTLSERFVALDPLEDIATTKTVGGVLPVGTETFNGFATPKYYAWLESKTELANGDIAGVWAVTDKAYTTLTLLVEIANYDFDGDPTAAIVTVTVDGTEYTMDAEGTKTGEFTGALYNADGTSVKTNDDEDPATSVWYEFQLPLSGKAAGDKVVASISYGSSAIAAGYITLGEYTPYKTITYQMDGRDVICITRVYEAGDAEGLLVIPKEIDGKPVVHLGDYPDDSTSILGNNPWVKAVQIQNPGEGLAVELRKKVFSWTSLESIIIDSDVVLQGNALPEQFAYGSTALTSVQLPDSITLINKEAFRNCTSLTSINMPAELVEIGPNAFRSAPLTGLEIVLSEKVTKVGYAAFYACGGLASVTALNKDCVFEVGGGQWDGHPFVATSCVFKGYTGSTLETFCAEQTLSERFVALDPSIPVIRGDINGDGVVDATDAQLLDYYLAGWTKDMEGWIGTGVELDLEAALIDADDVVTDWDAILLNRYVSYVANDGRWNTPVPEFAD